MLASDYHDYIHYAFADYSASSDVSAKFNRDVVSQKYFSGGGLLSKFKTDYKSQMISADTQEEYAELLDFIEDPDFYEKYFNVAYADVQSTSVRQMLKTDNLATAEQIAETVSSFLKNFNEVIELICNEIGVKGLDSFKSAVVKEYCAKKGVKAGSKNFSNSIIQDLLTHEGMKKLKLTSGVSADLDSSSEEMATLDSCLRSCLLAAEALKDFGVGGQLSGSSFGNKKYSTGTSNGSHYTGSSAGTLQVLVGKLQGLFSNIVGAGGELAFKKASEVGWKKFSSELEKTEKKWSTTVESKLAAGLGGGGKVTCTVRTTGSTVVKDKDKQDRNMVSKPDVEVIVTNNKVTIKYGASVKRYKANRDGVVQSVNLVAGSTTFLAALEQYCGGSKSTLNYVYNVAGGREGKSARSDKHIRASRRSVSLSELVDKWNDIRDCVVMSNFLHYLSGLENASSLFLVVNKQVYPVTDLLTKISANNVKASLWWKNVNGAGQEIGPRKMFTRKRMYVSNQWKGGKPRTHHDNDLAEARSQEAKSEIYSLLASVKLDVTLKDFATLCKS